jgi:20S proteasome alpha/beta subunit
MSLVIAVANRDSIVLAADTVCLLGGAQAHYRYDAPFSKIFPLRNNEYGVGVAAHNTAEQFVDIGQPSNSLDQLIRLIQDAVGRRYEEKQLDYEMFFLFCGFDPNDRPVIETVSFDGSRRKGFREEVTDKIRRSAIGICKQGALYLIHTYHDLDMTTEQLAFLAYFALKDAIYHDERLRGPIQLAVLRPHKGMAFYSLEQKQLLDTAYEERRSTLRALFTNPIAGLRF